MTRKTYFYADDDPDLYDRSVALTDRSYEMGHEALAACVQRWLRTRNLSASPRILDLGCGTGKEAIALLSLLPSSRLIAIDSSEPMLAAFRRKLMDLAETVLYRVQLQVADFTEVGWDQCLSLETDSTPIFDVVVAAHSLHHLTPKQKHTLYQDVYLKLAPNGIFAILDLFDFGQDWLSKLALDELIAWLSTRIMSASNFTSDDQMSPSRRKQLVDEWVRHIRTENAPLPISRSLPEEIGGAETESSMLQQVGFVEIEIPFRWFQSGLLVVARGR